MARGICDDELARSGREVAERDIDRDPLLALALEAVDEEREVELARLRAERLRVARGGGERVLVHHVGVVQEPPDERALPVVDRAAGEEAEEVLALVAREVLLDVARDQLAFGLVGAHQK